MRYLKSKVPFVDDMVCVETEFENTFKVSFYIKGVLT